MKIKRSKLIKTIKEEIFQALSEQTDERLPGHNPEHPSRPLDPGTQGRTVDPDDPYEEDPGVAYGLPTIHRAKDKKGYVIRGANLYESGNDMTTAMAEQGISTPIIQSHALIVYQHKLRKLKMIDPDAALRKAQQSGHAGMSGAVEVRPPRIETEEEARKRLDKELVQKYFSGVVEGAYITKDPFSGEEIQVMPTVDENWTWDAVVSYITTGLSEFGMGYDEDDAKHANNKARLRKAAIKETNKLLKKFPNWAQAPIGWNLYVDTKGRVHQEILGPRSKSATLESGGYYSLDKTIPENNEEFYMYVPSADRFVQAIVVRDVVLNTDGKVVISPKTNRPIEETTHIIYYLDQEAINKIREMLKDTTRRKRIQADVQALRIGAAIQDTQREGILPDIHDQDMLKEVEYRLKAVESWILWIKGNSPEFFAEILPDGLPRSYAEFEKRWRGDLNLRARLFVYMLPKTISMVAGAMAYASGRPMGGPISRKDMLADSFLKKLLYLVDYHNSLPEQIPLIGPMTTRNLKVLDVIRVQYQGTGGAPRRGITFGSTSGAVGGPSSHILPYSPEAPKIINLPAIEGDIIIVEYGKYVGKSVKGTGQNRVRVCLFRQKMPNGTYRWLQGGPAIDRGLNIVGMLPGEDTPHYSHGLRAIKTKLAPRIEIAKNVRFAHQFFWSKLGAAVMDLGPIDADGMPTYGLKSNQIKRFNVLDLIAGRAINDALDAVEVRIVPGIAQETLLARGRRMVDEGDRLMPDGLTRRFIRRVFKRRGLRIRLSGKRPTGLSSWLWEKVKRRIYPWETILGQRPMSGIIGDSTAAGGLHYEPYLDIYLTESPAGKKHLHSILEKKMETLKAHELALPEPRRAAYRQSTIIPWQALLDDIANMKNIDDIVHEEIRLMPERISKRFAEISSGQSEQTRASLKRAMGDEEARKIVRRLGGGAGAMQREVPEKVWQRVKWVLANAGVGETDRAEIIGFLRNAIVARTVLDLQKSEQGMINVLGRVAKSMEGIRKTTGAVYGRTARYGGPLVKGLSKGLYGLGIVGMFIDMERGMSQERPMNIIQAFCAAFILNFVDITGLAGPAMGFEEYKNPDSPWCRTKQSYLGALRMHTDNFTDLVGIKDAMNNPPDVWCFNWAPFDLSELDIEYFEATDLPEEEKEKQRGFFSSLSANPMDHPAAHRARVNKRLEYELIYNKLKSSMSTVPKFDPENEPGFEVFWMSEDPYGDTLYQVVRRDFFLTRHGAPITQEEYERTGKKRYSSKIPTLTPEEYWLTKVHWWWKQLMQKQVLYLKEKGKLAPPFGSEDYQVLSTIEYEELVRSRGRQADKMIIYFRSQPNATLYQSLREGGVPGDPYKFGGEAERNARMSYIELRIRAGWEEVPLGYDHDNAIERRKKAGGLPPEREKVDAIRLLKKYHEEYMDRPRLGTIMKKTGLAADYHDKPKDQQLIVLNRLRQKQLKLPPVMFFVSKEQKPVPMKRLLNLLRTNGPDFRHGDLNGQIIGGGTIDLDKYEEQVKDENQALGEERYHTGKAFLKHQKKYLKKINPGRVIFIPVEKGTDLEAMTTKKWKPEWHGEKEAPEALRDPSVEPVEAPVHPAKPVEPASGRKKKERPRPRPFPSRRK